MLLSAFLSPDYGETLMSEKSRTFKKLRNAAVRCKVYSEKLKLLGVKTGKASSAATSLLGAIDKIDLKEEK